MNEIITNIPIKSKNIGKIDIRLAIGKFLA